MADQILKDLCSFSNATDVYVDSQVNYIFCF